MSAIAGIVNLDQAPVDHNLLQLMEAAGVRRGPDSATAWVEGAVGFVFRGIQSSRLAAVEEQRPDSRKRPSALCLQSGRVSCEIFP